MLKKSYKKFLNKEIIYFVLEKIWRGIISSNQRNYETKRNDCVKLPETVLKTISDSSDNRISQQRQYFCLFGKVNRQIRTAGNGRFSTDKNLLLHGSFNVKDMEMNHWLGFF